MDPSAISSSVVVFFFYQDVGNVRLDAANSRRERRDAGIARSISVELTAPISPVRSMMTPRLCLPSAKSNVIGFGCDGCSDGSIGVRISRKYGRWCGEIRVGMRSVRVVWRNAS